MGRIIVTGGAGFIGANVVRGLNARGIDDIVVVDRLRDGAKWRNLLGLRVEDVVDKDDFRLDVREGAVAADIDAVIHLGACSSTTESDADYLLDNNYRYTRELCEWCLEEGIRFIYASSAATYGDGALGYSDEDFSTPGLAPLNMYGLSKHLFDLWALRRGHLDRIAGLKFFNVFGPHEDHKGDMRSVVHKAHSQILADGRVRLFKSYRPEFPDGGQVRDFLDVRDAVDVVLWLLDRPAVNGLFNCGTGEARSWNDLATAVFAALDREPRLDYIEMPEQLRGKYQYHTRADLAKLRRAGYDRPFTGLEDGIRDYVRGHLSTHAS